MSWKSFWLPQDSKNHDLYENSLQRDAINGHWLQNLWPLLLVFRIQPRCTLRDTDTAPTGPVTQMAADKMLPSTAPTYESHQPQAQTATSPSLLGLPEARRHQWSSVEAETSHSQGWQAETHLWIPQELVWYPYLHPSFSYLHTSFLHYRPSSLHFYQCRSSSLPVDFS